MNNTSGLATLWRSLWYQILPHCRVIYFFSGESDDSTMRMKNEWLLLKFMAASEVDRKKVWHVWYMHWSVLYTFMTSKIPAPVRFLELFCFQKRRHDSRGEYFSARCRTTVTSFYDTRLCRVIEDTMLHARAKWHPILSSIGRDILYRSRLSEKIRKFHFVHILAKMWPIFRNCKNIPNGCSWVEKHILNRSEPPKTLPDPTPLTKRRIRVFHWGNSRFREFTTGVILNQIQRY